MNTTQTTRRVAEFMESDLRTVAADDTIAEVIATLADGHVHGLPVLDGNTGRFVGVIATSDVLEALSEAEGASGRDAVVDGSRVSELMTRIPATIGPDATLDEAAKHMLYQDVHRLFVTEGDELVGVISQSDIVRALATGKV